jgi:hypothetical protein
MILIKDEELGMVFLAKPGFQRSGRSLFYNVDFAAFQFCHQVKHGCTAVCGIPLS